MRVVLIGTGRIGCGYLAPLFVHAGWEVVLAGRSADVVERIERDRAHDVRITSPAPLGTSGPPPEALVVPVEGYRGVLLGSEGFARAVAGADLVCVSVGVSGVEDVAAPLADALATRPADRPLDVWVVENDDVAGLLAARVRRAAQGRELPAVGFGGAVAHVAVARGGWRDAGRPEFVGDAARRLYVDTTGLTGRVPELPGVEGTADYRARLREKLYGFNAGHAICAYLGWLRGHETIADAVRDPFLRPMVAGSLLESRRALLATHPQLGTDVHGPVAEALARYADAELADPVVRVAREPIRKLGPDDRLLGPVRLVREQTGAEPPYFSLGVAGALLYRGDAGAQTLELQERLRRDGVRDVLEGVCGLDAADPFRDAVAARYAGFVLLPDETVFPPAYATAGAAGSAAPQPVR